MTQQPSQPFLPPEEIPTLTVGRIDAQGLKMNSEPALKNSKLHLNNAANQTTATNLTTPMNQRQPLPPPETKNPTSPPKNSTSGLEGSGKIAKSDIPVEDAEIPGELTPAQKRLAMQLASTYASIGMIASAFDKYDGIVLISQSEQRAMEMVAACRHNKQTMKWLERVAYGNDVIAAMAGHGIMLYAILANHERIKPNPVILARFGLTKEQVFGSIPGLAEAETNHAEPAKHP